MLLFRALSIGLFVIFLSGCGSTSSLNPKSILSGNNWVLYSLAGKEIDKGKFGNELPSLDFLDGEKLAGFSGCNNFSGEYQLQGANIQLSSGAMTKKVCPGIQEAEFISALERAKNFTVGKEKLTLLDGASELMSFIPKKD